MCLHEQIKASASFDLDIGHRIDVVRLNLGMLGGRCQFSFQQLQMVGLFG